MVSLRFYGSFYCFCDHGLSDAVNICKSILFTLRIRTLTEYQVNLNVKFTYLSKCRCICPWRHRHFRKYNT